ncbi:MAG: iron-sulfur cluster assembly protein [Patescibacteria group bacterium]
MQDLEKQIWRSLKNIIDPELGINIIDLGLIYEVRHEDLGQILIKMTLTTPGCPLAPEFVKMIKGELEKLPKIKKENVEVEFVFDPPWHQGMMSELAKAELGFL